MNIRSFRTLLIVWFAEAVVCSIWPLFAGWVGWPAEALAYVRWLEYNLTILLPLFAETTVAGIVFLLVGWLLLFCRASFGRYVFLAGLLVHAYSKYRNMPTIAASAELGLYAAFYALSGFVFGASFAAKDLRPA